MASRSAELNLYRKFSSKIRLIGADIWFLKSCKKFKVFPNFIKINLPKSNIAERVSFFAKQKWLDLEIKNLYTKRSILEVESYCIFKKLTSGLNNIEYEVWSEFQRKMFLVIDSKYKKKFSILNKKLKKLLPKKNSPQELVNIVENQSSHSFTRNEISILNKGLNFAVPPPRDNLSEIVAHIESSISTLPENSKSFVREACRNQISKNIVNNTNSNSQKNIKVVEGLRKKDVFYLKADKGNKVVILDKKEYFERVDNLIESGPYEKVIRNPLPKMITEVKNSLKKCKNLISDSLKFKLNVSNPTIPKLYCLPKIHKPGKAMRPIVSSVGSPTYLISKWLSKELEKLPLNTFAVKNSLEFINKTKDLVLNEGEILISFDVSSLFPSVPIPQTLQYLEELLRMNDFEDEIIREYLTLSKLCMEQNYFQYNSQFYVQKEGTAMGNCLSPFIANLFMSKFETEVSQEFEYFPRVWYRYVDDIFAIFDTKKADIDDFVSKLNSRYNSIKFTYEIENKGQLPFLDILIIKNDNRLEFDIYRKDTVTDRYIPNDSFHCKQHKLAALHFLVHRLVTFPLNRENFNNERNRIRNITRVNGYDDDLVNKLINRHKFRLNIQNSTFFTREENKSKYVSIPYNPKYSRGLSQVFNKVGLTLVYKSSDNLRNILGNPKDKIPNCEKSGIYEISCNDCDKKYVGQTRRSIKTRFKEHLAHLKYNRAEKSSIAEHALEADHTVTLDNLRLIKNVSDRRLLNAYESMEIIKCKSSLNKDRGPIPYSPLYWLLDRN